MDFVDWRKKQDQQQPVSERIEQQRQQARRVPGRISSRVEEVIREAQERGEFDNLAGMGKPLELDPHREAGDNAMAYHVLKNSGNVPLEIALLQQIDGEIARAQGRIARVSHMSRKLRRRRMPLFASEKRAFNAEVEQTATAYDEALRRINSNILTLNLTTPAAMHRPLLEVEKLVQQFRDECPLFT
jgi:Domain of unknown function (DUF1992).